MPYTDPSTIHNPSTGAVAPATWGDAVNDALNALANPPRCRVFRNAVYGIAHDTLTAVAWNDEQWDTDTMHSTVTNTTRITATTAGRYAVKGRIVFDNNNTGVRTAELRVNGSTGELVDIDGVNSPDSTEYAYMHVNGEVELEAGDYIELYVFQTSGGDLSVIGDASRDSAYCWFSAQWIGI